MENQIDELVEESEVTAQDVLDYFESLAAMEEDEETLHELNFE